MCGAYPKQAETIRNDQGPGDDGFRVDISNPASSRSAIEKNQIGSGKVGVINIASLELNERGVLAETQ